MLTVIVENRKSRVPLTGPIEFVKIVILEWVDNLISFIVVDQIH